MVDRRGSAVRWFALAAVTVSAASLLGVRGLDWLSQSGRIALVAYRVPAAAPKPAEVKPAEVQRASGDPGVDMTPTGSIPAGDRGGRALVIRIP